MRVNPWRVCGVDCVDCLEQRKEAGTLPYQDNFDPSASYIVRKYRYYCAVPH